MMSQPITYVNIHRHHRGKTRPLLRQSHHCLQWNHLIICQLVDFMMPCSMFRDQDKVVKINSKRPWNLLKITLTTPKLQRLNRKVCSHFKPMVKWKKRFRLSHVIIVSVLVSFARIAVLLKSRHNACQKTSIKIWWINMSWQLVQSFIQVIVKIIKVRKAQSFSSWLVKGNKGRLPWPKKDAHLTTVSMMVKSK
jgi:hypothetical protein